MAGVGQLAGYEPLVAAQPGGADRLADAGLVAIHLGRVDVAVADVEGGAYSLGRLLGRGLEHAVPELRDLVSVVECESGNGGGGGHGVGPPGLIRGRASSVARPC